MRSAKGSVQDMGRGRWRVSVEMPPDPSTGKRRRLSKVVRGSRKRAEEVKAELLMRAGDPEADMGRVTLDAFFRDRYMPDCRSRLRPNTCDHYEQRYRLYVQRPLGGMELRRITPAVVSSLLLSIDGENRRAEAFKTLRQALNKAVRWGVLASNPCDRADPPRPPRYDPEVLDAEGAAFYIDWFRGEGIEPAVLAAIGGGLRRSEIVGLDWADLDGGWLTVDNAVTLAGGRPRDDAPKTANGYRRVRLPDSVAERLEELRGEGPMVKDADGKRIGPDVLTRAYQRSQARMPKGAPRVPFKNLRHTSLTLAVEGGADLAAVSRRAGHASVAITSRYYLRPHDSVDEAVAGALDGVLHRVTSCGEGRAGLGPRPGAERGASAP